MTESQISPGGERHPRGYAAARAGPTGSEELQREGARAWDSRGGSPACEGRPRKTPPWPALPPRALRRRPTGSSRRVDGDPVGARRRRPGLDLASARGRSASERIGRGGGEDGRKGWLVMRARARCADVFGEGEASGRVAWSTGRPARARSAAQVPSRPRCRCHQSPRLAKFTSSPVLHHCCRVFLLSGCLIWIMPKQPVHSF